VIDAHLRSVEPLDNDECAWPICNNAAKSRDKAIESIIFAAKCDTVDANDKVEGGHTKDPMSVGPAMNSK
jgi:hypothetical protein